MVRRMFSPDSVLLTTTSNALATATRATRRHNLSCAHLFLEMNDPGGIFLLPAQIHLSDVHVRDPRAKLPKLVDLCLNSDLAAMT